MAVNKYSRRKRPERCVVAKYHMEGAVRPDGGTVYLCECNQSAS